MLPLKPPSAHLISKGWCGFLADKLYRSTCKSITPTLCFGVAVDGGGCEQKNKRAFRFRSIPKKYHSGQAGSYSYEGRFPDARGSESPKDVSWIGMRINF